MLDTRIDRPWVWAALGFALGAMAATAPRPDKAQAVRAVDVLVIGPFLLWLGINRRQLLPGARAAVAMIGAATVSYNAIHFFRTKAAPGERA